MLLFSFLVDCLFELHVVLHSLTVLLVILIVSDAAADGASLGDGEREWEYRLVEKCCLLTRCSHRFAFQAELALPAAESQRASILCVPLRSS
mmetsp:Transcript_249/g.448  ORF Transcript_249/g.448 Transcript_249/m.448 type:complete len:92 (+) Transcript_249:1612-1887(+)